MISLKNVNQFPLLITSIKYHQLNNNIKFLLYFNKYQITHKVIINDNYIFIKYICINFNSEDTTLRILLKLYKVIN